MNGYLGEFDVDISNSPFADYSKQDWAMRIIEQYGQFDGSHHKAWVLDQVARILKGTSVIVKEAKWDNGNSEYRISLTKPSQDYLDWVAEMLGEQDEDGGYEYDYDEGSPP